MRSSLTAESTQGLFARLRASNLAFAAAVPGESGARQPVHTVYGGAHLFRSDTAQKLGGLALRTLSEHFPDDLAFGRALGLGELASKVRARVRAKLESEPVEDLRIDFEDGYGNRPDAEEDAHAAQAAGEVALGLANGTLPPFIGLRIKPFSDELVARAARTLDLFVSTLVQQSGGKLPASFRVTLPKVVTVEQVRTCVELLALLEDANGLARRSLLLELMVETPQAIIGLDGTLPLPALVRACEGRCAGAHFGTYDYTALCGITAAHQGMTHPACDFARHAMRVSIGQLGVPLSDGATTVLPVPRHRAPEGGQLSEQQKSENREAVHRASRLHYDDVRSSLYNGYYQGWDLHPAQLVTRYAAVFAFFLEGLEAATARLRNFVQRAAQASLVGDVFDDAATGQGLLNYFLRGLGSGALSPEEVQATGLTRAELESRSFVQILEGRRARSRAEPGL